MGKCFFLNKRNKNVNFYSKKLQSSVWRQSYSSKGRNWMKWIIAQRKALWCTNDTFILPWTVISKLKSLLYPPLHHALIKYESKPSFLVKLQKPFFYFWFNYKLFSIVEHQASCKLRCFLFNFFLSVEDFISKCMNIFE